MGIRKTMNEKPAIGYGIGAACVVLAILFLIWHFSGAPAVAPPSDKKIDLSKAFYSDDDGKTTFLDAFAKVTPFQHNGKEAVRAYLYRCGTSEFVAYLGRDTELGRAEKLNDIAIRDVGTAAASPPVFEVKKPGSGNKWVPVDKNIAAWQAVTVAKCPDGSGIPVQLEPGEQ